MSTKTQETSGKGATGDSIPRKRAFNPEQLAAAREKARQSLIAKGELSRAVKAAAIVEKEKEKAEKIAYTQKVLAPKGSKPPSTGAKESKGSELRSPPEESSQASESGSETESSSEEDEPPQVLKKLPKAKKNAPKKPILDEDLKQYIKHKTAKYIQRHAQEQRPIQPQPFVSPYEDMYAAARNRMQTQMHSEIANMGYDAKFYGH